MIIDKGGFSKVRYQTNHLGFATSSHAVDDVIHESQKSISHHLITHDGETLRDSHVILLTQAIRDLLVCGYQFSHS